MEGDDCLPTLVPSLDFTPGSLVLPSAPRNGTGASQRGLSQRCVGEHALCRKLSTWKAIRRQTVHDVPVLAWRIGGIDHRADVHVVADHLSALLVIYRAVDYPQVPV